MSAAVRFLIALVALFSQSMIGSATLTCAQPSNAKIACPMGMSMGEKTCCPCCKPTSAHKTPVCPSNCVTKNPTPTPPATLATVPPIQTLAILALPTLELTLSAEVNVLPLPQHLAIPRVRPPNPRLHGLRAPPIR